MLRFHKSTIGGAWLPEYGSPDKKEEFEYIYKWVFFCIFGFFWSYCMY